MADQDARPDVGTVAEEAARLLDALGGWAAQAGYAAQPAPRHTGTPERSDEEGTADAAQHADEPEGAHPASHCERCGAADGAGQAVVCRLCPVCQAIGILRSVRPETVDRLADLAGAVAATLRDLADQRRADGPDPEPPARRTSRPRVQDITVEDEAGS